MRKLNRRREDRRLARGYLLSETGGEQRRKLPNIEIVLCGGGLALGGPGVVSDGPGGEEGVGGSSYQNINPPNSH
jgi:hypothetical protein